jgi:hypothetical protein
VRANYINDNTPYQVETNVGLNQVKVSTAYGNQIGRVSSGHNGMVGNSALINTGNAAI